MGRLWLLALAASACGSFGDLAIDRIEPSSGSNGDAVPVQIAGSNFHLPLRSSLDDGSTTVLGDVIATIGDVPLAGAVRETEELIDGAVPAGLPVGTYDVRVTIGDRTATLPGGYTVTSSRVQPPAGPCGRPGVLADDFADGVAAPAWIVVDAAHVVEQDHTLVVTPAVDDAGYRSEPYVDLRDGAAEVEVRDVGPGITAYFRVTNAGQELAFRAANGTLSMFDSTGASVMAIAFDPVAHRNWRIAESNGMVSFETSPDGRLWAVQYAVPTPSWAPFVQVELGATGQGGSVTFGEFSTFVAPSTWCPVAMLGDAFDGGAIGAAWAYHGHANAGCSEFQTGGTARVDQAGTQACDAFFASSSRYALANSQMVVRITAITTFTPGWITYFAAVAPTGESVRLRFDQNQMCADGTGVQARCAAYDQAEDLWRIREAGGTLVFEVANSATATFRQVTSAPVTFALDAIRVRFGTLTDHVTNLSIGLAVDRFN